jgi:chitosanase
MPETTQRGGQKRRGPAVSFVCAITIIGAAATTAIAYASAQKTSPKPASTAISRWMTKDQRRRADQLVSVFEDSTTTIQYAMAENLHDGRGITAGRSGFTTATCDALAVVKQYSITVRKNVFDPFKVELTRLCEEQSESTDSLGEASFIAAWQTAAADPRFRSAQDVVNDRMYFVPAMKVADSLGLKTLIARAQIYDAAIQHGFGEDLDSVEALVSRTNERIGSPDISGEANWLNEFLTVRLDDLQHPFDEATAQAWAESTDRIKCFQTIAAANNMSLRGPITCDVFGTTYTIK